jgi:hypothetical protein
LRIARPSPAARAGARDTRDLGLSQIERRPGRRLALRALIVGRTLRHSAAIGRELPRLSGRPGFLLMEETFEVVDMAEETTSDLTPNKARAKAAKDLASSRGLLWQKLSKEERKALKNEVVASTPDKVIRDPS